MDDVKTLIEVQLKEIATGLESKANLSIGTAKTEIEAKIAEVKNQIEKLNVLPEGVDITKMAADLKSTIEGFDAFQAKYNDKGAKESKLLTLGEAVSKAIADFGAKEIDQVLKNPTGAISLKLGPVDLKAQGSDMTTANSLTGDPQRSYNNRQGVQPAQALNFRDLMNTVQSPTGTFVTYTEDTGETNNIVLQTEGATKGQNQYTLTEKVNTNGYIAGFSVVAKQLFKNLPFLQNTLPRLLLRDFYKAENSAFWTTVSGAATGPTTMGTSADDVKQLIYLIGGFKNTNYNPSYAVVNPVLMARLITSTYTNGYYPGAGTITLNGGSGAPLTISGVPIYEATWVADQKCLLVDMDYLERVETEGLNIAFSYEDSTNFRANKVTARIECQESVNLMLAPAACYADLGAS